MDDASRIKDMQRSMNEARWSGMVGRRVRVLGKVFIDDKGKKGEVKQICFGVGRALVEVERDPYGNSYWFEFNNLEIIPAKGASNE